MASLRVAIIGAGAGGLAAAKELLSEGHRPVVYEQGASVGGVWAYDPATDEELLGLDPERERVHSSMYINLRTNLPREMMSYLDFPFTSDFLQAVDGGRGGYQPDARRYPGHAEVNAYLHTFADHHSLRQHIHLQRRVVTIRPVPRQVLPASSPHQTLAHRLAASSPPAHSASDTISSSIRGSTPAVPADTTPHAHKGPAIPSGGSSTSSRAVDTTPAGQEGHDASTSQTSMEVLGAHQPADSLGHSGPPGAAHVRTDQAASTASDAHHAVGTSEPGGAQHAQLEASAVDAVNPSGGSNDVAVLESCPRWRVVTEDVAPSVSGRLPAHGGQQHEEEFDAVLICSGHFAEPRLPSSLVESGLKGGYPGLQMHSHSYRSYEQFAGQVVMVIGSSNSGDDIAREVALVADTVYLSARSWNLAPGIVGPGSPPFGPRSNIHRRDMAVELCSDGSAVLQSGERLPHIDAVIYCTGYEYAYPFLPDVVSTVDNHVYPLYKHFFPPAYAPSLAFIGILWKTVPFPQMQLQARMFARLLSGKAQQLPNRHDMMEDVKRFCADLDERGVAYRYAHMCEGPVQWDYNDWLADMCDNGGRDRLPAWRRQMYELNAAIRRRRMSDYRDIWEDPERVVDQALASLKEQADKVLAGVTSAKLSG